MKVVYFGSGAFGLETLRAVAEAGHDILLVVSQPDKPAGRGGRMRQTPIKAKALEMGLTVECPQRPNTEEFARRLEGLRPDVAVVVAYGHLIRANLLAIPHFGFVNLHASLLPAYRGAAPVPWAILKGERVSGATVFSLDERFDTGAILGRVEVPILESDTTGTYLERLAPAGAELVGRVLSELEGGVARAVVQDNALASAAPKFTKEDGRIEWGWVFAEIERKVRAFQPWPQAWTVLEGEKGMIRMNVGEVVRVAGEGGGRGAGSVVAADVGAGLVVVTGDGLARLSRIQPEGKRMMADVDFLRGTKIRLS